MRYEPPSTAYSFADLAHRGGTGRAYTISGTGRDRKIGYRVGVTTKVGDIEQSEWKQLMHELIRSSGEEPLYLALVEWHKNTAFLRTKKEVEDYALQLHSNRIFDNPLWVGYIGFNRKYRPEVLENAELVEILPHCCKQPGFITKERLDSASFSFDGPTVPCPICGRFSTFGVITRREVL